MKILWPPSLQLFLSKTTQVEVEGAAEGRIGRKEQREALFARAEVVALYLAHRATETAGRRQRRNAVDIYGLDEEEADESCALGRRTGCRNTRLGVEEIKSQKS